MTQRELDIGTAALRKVITAAGYGSFVTDKQLESGAYAVIEAVDDHRRARDEVRAEK